MNRLDVNCSQVDITPAEPVMLSGYANRKGLSTKIHRPLSSRCVAFRAGSSTLCLIVNDLVDIMPEPTHDMIARIVRGASIPEDVVFVHAIHTHSGPVMEHGFTEANDRYINWAVDRIVQNAVRTIVETEKYQSCSIRQGRSMCDISASRRRIDPQTGVALKVANAESAIDREVRILQLVNDTGKAVLTLFNYACHPVVLGYDSLVVSTDYPGAAREAIEKALGGMAVFLNGAAGDINPFLTDQTDPAVADREGMKLASVVLRATLETWEGEVDIRIRNQVIHLPYRDQNMTAERFDREVERRLGDQTEFFNWRQDLRTWGDAMIIGLKNGTVPNTCSIEAAALKIGPVVFVLSQGEVFNAYQMRAKQNFPSEKIFFVGYINGTRGYIPTAEAFKHGGYEVDQAYIYSGEPSPLTPETERVYMDALNALLRAVS
jgi:neutral ceramidase